jgi:TolB protein
VEQSYVASHIWAVAYPSGETRRVTGDLNTYHGVEITADGTTLVTQQMQRSIDLWLVPVGESRPPRRLTSVGKGFNGDDIDWLPDGRIVYDSNVGGNWDLWIIDEDGTNQRRLTVSPTADLQPTVSPDGRFVVWTSDRGGKVDLWKMEIDGGNATQLTHEDMSFEPSWSPDGRWIVYQSVGEEPGQINTYRIAADGGERVRLSEMNSGQPKVSPDSKQVLHTAFHDDEKKWKRDVISLETGELEVSIYIKGAQEHDWSPDGSAIVYSKHTDGIDNMWSQPLDGGEPQQITHFDKDHLWAARWSRDGQTLAVARGRITRDVVLLKNFR